MKVEYKHSFNGQMVQEELESFLQPTYTGSEQGSIEQLESELKCANQTIGRLLAALVEKNVLPFEAACEISGKHEYYVEYNLKQLKLVR